jgi:hypothetical protein
MVPAVVDGSECERQSSRCRVSASSSSYFEAPSSSPSWRSAQDRSDCGADWNGGGVWPSGFDRLPGIQTSPGDQTSFGTTRRKLRCDYVHKKITIVRVAVADPDSLRSDDPNGVSSLRILSDILSEFGAPSRRVRLQKAVLSTLLLCCHSEAPSLASPSPCGLHLWASLLSPLPLPLKW